MKSELASNNPPQNNPPQNNTPQNKPSRQALRRWGNSLGVRLPVAIAREAHLEEDQDVELTVVEDGVLIRPVQQRLSLEQRLAAYVPMASEPTEAMAWQPLGAELPQ